MHQSSPKLNFILKILVGVIGLGCSAQTVWLTHIWIYLYILLFMQKRRVMVVEQEEKTKQEVVSSSKCSVQVRVCQ